MSFKNKTNLRSQEETSSVESNSQPIAISDFMNHSLPVGYQTIPGWWATKMAEAWEFLGDPLETFKKDADKLSRQLEETGDGSKVLWLPAPIAFKRIGREGIRAFPIDLLADFYPANG